MSDNNKNEIKETWIDKVFLVLGGLLILVIFRLVGRAFGISAIAGLIGGVYVYEYIAKTRSTVISIIVGVISSFMITFYGYILFTALFS